MMFTYPFIHKHREESKMTVIITPVCLSGHEYEAITDKLTSTDFAV